MCILLNQSGNANASLTTSYRNISVIGKKGHSDLKGDEPFRLANTCLVSIGKEIMEPSVVYKTVDDLQKSSINPLPAGPTAILTVLIGFACVSLAKDHRFWLTMLIALSGGGNAYINPVPQLAMKFCSLSQVNRSVAERSANFYLFKNTVQASSSLQIKDTYLSQQFAIITPLSPLVQATNLLSPPAKWFVCFSPAFIFSNLSRSPPHLA